MDYLDYATYYYIFLSIIGIAALWFKAVEQVEDFIKKEQAYEREYAKYEFLEGKK